MLKKVSMKKNSTDKRNRFQGKFRFWNMYLQVFSDPI